MNMRKAQAMGFQARAYHQQRLAPEQANWPTFLKAELAKMP